MSNPKNNLPATISISLRDLGKNIARLITSRGDKDFEVDLYYFDADQLEELKEIKKKIQEEESSAQAV